jgi:tricorn protease
MNSPIIEGPKVMLINENAGSGGDMLPYLFREAKLGPLIGKRTWGGLVGIGGSAPLVDGGFLTAPEFSIYDPKTNEIVAENTGVDPDIDIDNRPDLVAQGRDPQLERAVEYLLDQLKKLPAKKPRTTIPTVGKNGRIGGK